MTKRRYKVDVEYHGLEVLEYDAEDLEGMTEDEILVMVENDALQNASAFVERVDS